MFVCVSNFGIRQHFEKKMIPFDSAEKQKIRPGTISVFPVVIKLFSRKLATETYLASYVSRVIGFINPVS